MPIDPSHSTRVKQYFQLQKGWSTCINSNRDAEAARQEDQMEALWLTLSNEEQRYIIKKNNE
jgi:hypothetical protein